MRLRDRRSPRHMRPKVAREVECGEAIDGSPCETCRHRDRVDRGDRVVLDHLMRDVDDVCLASRDLRDGGTCFRLTRETIPDHCPRWDMEVL